MKDLAEMAAQLNEENLYRAQGFLMALLMEQQTMEKVKAEKE